jgi:hypothetical protein
MLQKKSSEKKKNLFSCRSKNNSFNKNFLFCSAMYTNNLEKKNIDKIFRKKKGNRNFHCQHLKG